MLKFWVFCKIKFKIGAIAVPKNKMNVLTDKKETVITTNYKPNFGYC